MGVVGYQDVKVCCRLGSCTTWWSFHQQEEHFSRICTRLPWKVLCLWQVPSGGTDNTIIDSYLKPEVNKTFSTSPIYLQHQRDVRVMHWCDVARIWVLHLNYGKWHLSWHDLDTDTLWLGIPPLFANSKRSTVSMYGLNTWFKRRKRSFGEEKMPHWVRIYQDGYLISFVLTTLFLEYPYKELSQA